MLVASLTDQFGAATQEVPDMRQVRRRRRSRSVISQAIRTQETESMVNIMHPMVE
jgi:hypothetical protein